MKANKNFEKIVFDVFGQDKNYDRCKHNILNVRETMLKRHPSFNQKSLMEQFEYCETIATIAVHTQLQHINEHRPLSSKEDVRYKYSIDRDWKEIKIIKL